MIGAQRRALIREVFERLLAAFGPQHWWPAETRLEVIVGAILTQNTAWRNVETAISRLKQQDLLKVDAMLEIPEQQLQELIRSSGYYNQKARRLKIFFEHIRTRWDGDLEGLLSLDLLPLREELLGINGIGPETADSIILYAAQQPSFVVDTYTHRVLSRHGWFAETYDYHRLRDYFMDYLQPNVYFFQEIHALLVRTGNEFCRRKPSCRDCPLRPLLAQESGPSDDGISL